MKAARRLSPPVVGLTLAALFALPFVSIPLTAAQEAPEAQQPAAPAEEEGEAKPPRPGRWERLREKITIEGAQYAGTETCAQSRCHSDTVATWSDLRHTQHLLQADTWSEEERSCEGCHGPASRHLIDRQHGNIARLGEHPEYVAALCNRCHHNNIEETHFLAGIHIREKVNCGTCHDVHRDHGSVALLRGPGVRQLWLGYSKKRTPPRPRPAPTPSPAPEATPAPSEGAAPGASPVQLTAQAEGAPAEAAPAPPAASPAAPQPPAAPPAPRKDPGALTGFASTRFMTELEKVNELCLACHQQQRGQFHQNSRHPLFEGRLACTSCHNPHNGNEFGPPGGIRIARDIDNLCNRCHTDKRGPFIFEHDMSLTEDGCLTCHRAHGSPNNKLLKLNGRGLCLQCHSDINLDPAHQRRPGSCWRAGCHVDIHGSQSNRLFLRAGAGAQGAAPSVGVASRPLTPRERQAHAGWISDFRRWLASLAAESEEEALASNQVTAQEDEASQEIQPLRQSARPVRAGAAPEGREILAGGRVPAKWVDSATPGSGRTPASRPGGAPEGSVAPPRSVTLVAADADAEPAAAEAPTPAVEAEEPSPPRRFFVDGEVIGSYGSLNIGGNRSKAYQYTVPPSGFYSELLRLTVQDDLGGLFGSGWWRGLDEPRQIASVRLENVRPMGAGARLRYLYDRAAFFIDPALIPLDSSDRKNQAFEASWVPSRRLPSLHFHAEGQRVEAPGISRLTTNGALGAVNYNVDRYVPELRYRLGGGNIRLQYMREEFDNYTLSLPNAQTNDWQVQYDRLLGSIATVSASYSRATIDQAGLPDRATNQQARLGVTARVLPQLSASAQFVTTDIRQPNTFNAYVRDRDSFVARLRYRPLTRLSLEGGYERSDFRRLNNTQTFVHTPNWDGGWIALRARPHDSISLSARHRIRRLSDAPPATILGLPNQQPLFFDEDDRTEAQLTVTLPRDALLYLNYGRNRQQNDPRDVGFRFNTWNTGISMPLGPRASLNADWSRQEWEGRGDALTRDPLRLNFGRPLNSDGNSLNLGLSYLSGQDTLTLSLYRFTASGGESVRAQGILLGYEPRWPGWVTPRFQFGWDDYEDHFISGFDYQSVVFRIDLAGRF